MKAWTDNCDSGLSWDSTVTNWDWSWDWDWDWDLYWELNWGCGGAQAGPAVCRAPASEESSPGLPLGLYTHSQGRPGSPHCCLS